MTTELEYLNMLPADLSRVQDLTEASFMKGVGNNSMMKMGSIDY